MNTYKPENIIILTFILPFGANGVCLLNFHVCLRIFSEKYAAQNGFEIRIHSMNTLDIIETEIVNGDFWMSSSAVAEASGQ